MCIFLTLMLNSALSACFVEITVQFGLQDPQMKNSKVRALCVAMAMTTEL